MCSGAAPSKHGKWFATSVRRAYLFEWQPLLLIRMRNPDVSHWKLMASNSSVLSAWACSAISAAHEESLTNGRPGYWLLLGPAVRGLFKCLFVCLNKKRRGDLPSTQTTLQLKAVLWSSCTAYCIQTSNNTSGHEGFAPPSHMAFPGKGRKQRLICGRLFSQPHQPQRILHTPRDYTISYLLYTKSGPGASKQGTEQTQDVCFNMYIGVPP